MKGVNNRFLTLQSIFVLPLFGCGVQDSRNVRNLNNYQYQTFRHIKQLHNGM